MNLRDSFAFFSVSKDEKNEKEDMKEDEKNEKEDMKEISNFEFFDTNKSDS